MRTTRAAIIDPVRISAPGVRPSDDVLSLVVDGRSVACRRGDTLAAALVDVGARVCRVTASGDARGIFCGMGVCQECVMTIDGAPGRACMTFVRDGMSIATLRGDGPTTTRVADARLEPVVMAPELLVVGAGPAGLAAAAAAADA